MWKEKLSIDAMPDRFLAKMADGITTVLYTSCEEDHKANVVVTSESGSIEDYSDVVGYMEIPE